MRAIIFIWMLTAGLFFAAIFAAPSLAADPYQEVPPYQKVGGTYQNTGGYKSDVQLRYESQKRLLGQQAQSRKTQSSVPDLLPNNSSQLDGLYVGGQFGLSMLSSELTYNDATDTLDQDGVGGTGYNFSGYAGIGKSNTRTNLYIGGEADLTLSSVSSETTLNNGKINIEVDYMYFLNARAGYLVSPRSMIYMKAGVGLMQWDVSSNQGINGEDKKLGVLLGVGIEHMIRDRVSLRTEFSFTKWEKHDNTVGREDIELVPAMLNFYIGASYHF